jgi:hypothetical protein
MGTGNGNGTGELRQRGDEGRDDVVGGAGR